MASHIAEGDFLYRLVDKSFEMEMNRYESLQTSSGRVMSCVSILSVALLTIVDVVYPVFDGKREGQVLACFAIVAFGPLLFSFLLAVSTQIRFKYQALNYPSKFAESTKNYLVNKGGFEDDCFESSDVYARELDTVFSSLRDRNLKIQRLLSGSIYALYFEVALIALEVIVGFSVLAN